MKVQSWVKIEWVLYFRFKTTYYILHILPFEESLLCCIVFALTTAFEFQWKFPEKKIKNGKAKLCGPFQSHKFKYSWNFNVNSTMQYCNHQNGFTCTQYIYIEFTNKAFYFELEICHVLNAMDIPFNWFVNCKQKIFPDLLIKSSFGDWFMVKFLCKTLRVCVYNTFRSNSPVGIVNHQLEHQNCISMTLYKWFVWVCVKCLWWLNA